MSDLDKETAELVMGWGTKYVEGDDANEIVADDFDGWKELRIKDCDGRWEEWEPTEVWDEARIVIDEMAEKGWSFRQDEIPNRPPQAMFYKGSRRYVACGATILEAICQAAVTTMKDKR
jgi:hypothetical protein